ncbi:MAG: hypothetical protein IT303_00530 [Dehalococcoidia bacterium]|nr:hypothetical protein [Dehalococcoidia bacterium]
MLVKGDVKCLHCGFISGQWLGIGGAPIRARGMMPVQGAGDPEALVRCGRCHGPVFLDEPDVVMSASRVARVRRMRAQLEAMEGAPAEVARAA